MRRIKTFIYTFAYIYICLPVCTQTKNIVIWLVLHLHLFYTKSLSSEVVLLIFLHIFVSLITSGAILWYGVGGQERRQ